MPRPILDADLGLRVLVDPQNAREDILAIHGRGAHPDDTWCHIREHGMGHTEDNYINWLSDPTMLPDAIHTARVMRFGYRSAWYGDDRLFTSPQEISSDLLRKLKIARGSCPYRPLIIVAHSFGGIVVMQMLMTARSDYFDIYNSVTGLVFFGTPFRGNGHLSREILLQLASNANQEISEGQLDISMIDSPYLQSLFTDFQQALSDVVKPKIACFYEQKPTDLGRMFIKKTDKQEQKLEQKAILWVNEMSATLDLTDRAFEKYSRSCNHLNLNKFQLATHSDFQTLVDALQTMAQSGPGLIQQRALKTRRTSSGNPPVIPGQLTLKELDEEILSSYKHGRLRIERLSGDPLPLESCFINLSIIHHYRDIDRRSTDNSMTGNLSPFSLAKRFKTEMPSRPHQVSLETLFTPREERHGRLSQPARVLIWGRAGMGKTTLCKKIVHDVYTNGLWNDLYDRVIWLPLRRLKQSQSRSVVQLLESEFPCAGLGTGISEAFRRLIRDDRTLFLLDGLDEVSLVLESDGPQHRVLRELLSQAHVIITSRPHNTHDLAYHKPDLELETVGFSQSQIDEYLQRTICEDIMSEIQSFIQQRPLIRSLAAIPVQLDAICYCWEMESFRHDYATMTSLYIAISESLWKNIAYRLGKTANGKPLTRLQFEYGSWQETKTLVQNEIALLLELAFRGLCEEITEFNIEYIASIQDTYTVPSNEMVHLAFLRTSDSSLKIRKRTFHFIHLTYQEFFAAQYFVGCWMSDKPLLVRQATVNSNLSTTSTKLIMLKDFVHSRKYLDRYNIFWRFVVGLLQAEQHQEYLHGFLDTLESSPLDLIGLSHQRLIIYCLSELRQGNNELQTRTRKLEDRYIQWSLHQLRLLQSWNEEIENRSILLLQEVECSEYMLETLFSFQEAEVDVLNALLNRPSISQRMLDIVVQKVRATPNEIVRDTAVKLFGRHCRHGQVKFLKLFKPLQIVSAWDSFSGLLEPAIVILIQLIRYPDSNVRKSAANALGEQATLSDAAVEALIQLLRDPESNVRESAANALREQATVSDATVEALIQLLRDPESNIRKSAAFALGRQATLSDAAVEALIQLLRDPESNAQKSAAFALRRQATLSDAAVEALIQLLRDPESNVRKSAAFALGEQATLSDAAVETLIQLLRDPESNIRESAALVFKEQATLSDAAVEALIQLLRDPKSNIRERAANALGGQATLSNWVTEQRIQPLRDPESTIQKSAAWVLGRQATLSDAAVETLIQLLRDPESNVRKSAANALREQATLSDATVEALIQLLRDPESNIRKSAAFALGRQATLSDAAVEALIQQLRDPESNIRESAAFALGEQATFSDAAVEALIQLLRDPESNIRGSAAFALGRQATLSDAAVEALIQLLRDPESNVRGSAAFILREQATFSDATVEALIQLLRDPESNIRESAAFALGRQATLSDAEVKALIQLLQDPESHIRKSAAFALGRQATLPNAAVEALTQLLRNSSFLFAKPIVELIIGRPEIQAYVSNLNSSELQHFIRYWFTIGSEACFIWNENFYLASSEITQKTQQHKMKEFELQWQIARSNVGLPDLIPILSRQVT